jgi:hypothetical protein
MHPCGYTTKDLGNQSTYSRCQRAERQPATPKHGQIAKIFLSSDGHFRLLLRLHEAMVEPDGIEPTTSSLQS